MPVALAWKQRDRKALRDSKNPAAEATGFLVNCANAIFESSGDRI